MIPARDRRFLFLQGPHGPFFWRLAGALRAAGAACRRVGFGAGDRLFWPERASYTADPGTPEGWPDRLAALVEAHAITDLVLYGDTRPLHAAAVALGRARGLTVHVFEEGYIRPWWITYERGGANGHSPLMRLSLGAMQAALAGQGPAPPVEAPAHWGEMRQHMGWGALYHAAELAGGRRRRAPPRRGISVEREFALHLARLLAMPAHAALRFAATRRIRRGGFPYHLALLQLEHDASFRAHGPFAAMTDFTDAVIAGFAAGAPAHHHLVFKAHPLEDGRAPLRRAIARAAAAQGIARRVHLLRGGKLGPLLDTARSAVTVNSTAAQQALWRGLPVRAFGEAVYTRPGLVSEQPLAAFFAAPEPPDRAAYATFRQFLLETSQVAGGYYSRRGRAQLCRQLPDMMLAPADRYALRMRPRAADPRAAAAQHLRLLG